MCGRAGFFEDEKFLNDVRQVVRDIDNRIQALQPRYNIAPSQPIPALLNDRRYLQTHFGFIPSWAKERGRRPINARCETIDEKPMFKSAFRHRRALIPVNGFYEWQRSGKHKQPYWIHPTDGDYFALGAIWDEWHDGETGEIITSSAIITTEPNGVIRPIHDRMPVILAKKDWQFWLDAAVTEYAALRPLMQPCEDTLMEAYTVSTLVNSPANEGMALMQSSPAGSLF